MTGVSVIIEAHHFRLFLFAYLDSEMVDQITPHEV